ncbi:hypothetical protein SBOR_8102 [Sclerotinia borealis F-4128]|uniref:Uncharacterized protein n=1 Tax=Sclerotinia borealis (strain F-4128) TaxID=1432307 RepID=W9C6P7_SCLBF|nr:hypothetical protein SBOR_8102 [Sclerotinia borealis F-4128]
MDKPQETAPDNAATSPISKVPAKVTLDSSTIQTTSNVAFDLRSHDAAQHPASTSSFTRAHETPEFLAIRDFVKKHSEDFDNIEINCEEKALVTISPENEERDEQEDGLDVFLILYSLLARIQHAGLKLKEACAIFSKAWTPISLNCFEALIKEAEAFKARKVLESKCFLTKLLKCSKFQLSDVLSTILPDIYDKALTWSQALEKFNSQFGSQLGMSYFKRCVRPLILKKLIPTVGNIDPPFMNNDLGKCLGLSEARHITLGEEVERRDANPKENMRAFNKIAGLNINDEVLQPALTELLIVFMVPREELGKILGPCEDEDLCYGPQPTILQDLMESRLEQEFRVLMLSLMAHLVKAGEDFIESLEAFSKH